MICFISQIVLMAFSVKCGIGKTSCNIIILYCLCCSAVYLCTYVVLAAYASHPFHYRSGFDFCSQDLFNILTRSGTTRICQGIRFIQVPIYSCIYIRDRTPCGSYHLSYFPFYDWRKTLIFAVIRTRLGGIFYSNHVVTVHYAFYFINTTIFVGG